MGRASGPEPSPSTPASEPFLSRGLVAVASLLWALPASAGEVLVYIANEPAPTAVERKNVDDIVGWLNSSGLDDDRLLAAGIRFDQKLFPRAVDNDVADIAAAAAGLDGVVVATNRLVQQGQLLVAAPHAGLQPVHFQAVPARDGRGESSPLADAANLDAVFAAAAAAFDVNANEFVVVVHSHGDADWAVTPRLGLPTAGLTRETLLDRVHGRDNAFVARYGVTTVDLVALVAKQRAARGLRTSLLALVSCNSVVERLPPEVPRILVAAGGEALVYGAVDYAAALALTSSAPLSSSLIAAWTPRPLEVADPAVVAARRRHALLDRAQRVLPWLLPLAAWIVVVGAAVRRRRQRERQRR